MKALPSGLIQTEKPLLALDCFICNKPQYEGIEYYVHAKAQSRFIPGGKVSNVALPAGLN